MASIPAGGHRACPRGQDHGRRTQVHLPQSCTSDGIPRPGSCRFSSALCRSRSSSRADPARLPGGAEEANSPGPILRAAGRKSWAACESSLASRSKTGTSGNWVLPRRAARCEQASPTSLPSQRDQCELGVNSRFVISGKNEYCLAEVKDTETFVAIRQPTRLGQTKP